MTDIIILSIFSLIQSAVIHWLIKKWYKEKAKNLNNKKDFTVDEAYELVMHQWKTDHAHFYKFLAEKYESIANVLGDTEIIGELREHLKNQSEDYAGRAAIHEFNSIAKTHVQTEEK